MTILFSTSITTALANDDLDSKQNNTNPVDYISASSYGTTAELSLSHAPKLGEEAQLTFIVGVMPQLNRTFKDLSAQVVLPEGFTLVSGDLSWQGDLEPGQTVQITSTIKATKTGDWSIGGSIKGAFDYLYVYVSETHATVSRIPFDIPEHDFTPLSSQAQISSSSSLPAGEALSSRSVTGSSDSDLLNPENFKLRPLSQNLFVQNDTQAMTSSESATAQSVGGFITIKGYWYFSDRTDTNVPGPRTFVCAFDSDSDGAVITLLTKTDTTSACAFTDTSGFFEIGPIVNNDGFLEGGFDVFVRFFTINNEIDVSDLSFFLWDATTPQKDNVQDGDVWFPLPPSGQFIFINLPPTNENPAWQVFYTLIEGWDYLANQGPNFDTSVVGTVFARWDPSACAASFESGSCGSPPGGAHYHPIGTPVVFQEIHLDGRCDPARCSETTGGHASAPDVIFHEFGHAVMDFAYNNVGGSIPAVTNCNPHIIGVDSSTTCAWVEGMATILSLIVGGDSTYDSNLSNFQVEYENPSIFWDPGDQDEGYITSTLWDFHDSTNEGLDLMSNEILDFWNVFLAQQDNTFSEFWTSWKNAGKNTNRAGPTVFHNTINYDNANPSNPTSLASSSHTLATPSSDNTIDMNWSGATDDFSGVSGYSTEFDLISNTLPDQTLDTSATSITSQALTSNNWFFHVRTVDNDNNWSTNALHAGPFPLDVTLPAAPTISSPSSGITTNDNTVDLTGDAESLSIVEIFDGATSLGTTTATSPWSFTTPALSDGAHTITATATDEAGNTSPASAAVTVTVDTAPPAAPTISSPSSGITTNTDILTIAGDAESLSIVEIFDGATSLGTTTATSPWSFTTPALSDGAHTITATATDEAGNTSPASASVAITTDTSSCHPPSSGEWIVAVSCTLDQSSTATANVRVQNNSVLTIPSGLTLTIDFSQFNLTVEFGSGVRIKAGGTISSPSGEGGFG